MDQPSLTQQQEAHHVKACAKKYEHCMSNQLLYADGASAREGTREKAHS